jgi:hypothetical protein
MLDNRNAIFFLDNAEGRAGYESTRDHGLAALRGLRGGLQTIALGSIFGVPGHGRNFFTVRGGTAI